MLWEAAIHQVRPHVVRIQTPNAQGTGFLALYNYDSSWCGIATAAHVVEYADTWQLPIKIDTENDSRFLNSNERVVFLDHQTDSAVVLFLKGNLRLPETPITLIPMDDTVSIGSEAGWLGYPNTYSDMMCFFAGTVSGRNVAQRFYLIDGVAIHGVSGGPVFRWSSQGEVQIIGVMVAYHANLATGAPLPGMSRAQDVSHFHGVINHIKSIDDANVRKKEFEEQSRGQAGTAIATMGGQPAASPRPDDNPFTRDSAAVDIPAAD
ncbi:trypsin-like peptidase domain-containing protein [Bradyrhizobium sp. 83002]|uniref:S1 family peptidase n=1 Tax=Bradyrhizobium aeschynomenes TaxID=2734909 RepID=UPI0015554C4A|nr:serine protease [Bradyrhizobium aeschynomenes]NPU10918.1 trypsin-like peptidase domain-containing protein [Bradyrhizobium aeschynomenes]